MSKSNTAKKETEEATDIALMPAADIANAMGLNISPDVAKALASTHSASSSAYAWIDGTTGVFSCTEPNITFTDDKLFGMNVLSLKAVLNVWEETGGDSGPPMTTLSRTVFRNPALITGDDAIKAVPDLSDLTNVTMKSTDALIVLKGEAPNGDEKTFNLKRGYVFTLKDVENTAEVQFTTRNPTSNTSLQKLITSLVSPTSKYQTHTPVITVGVESFKNNFGRMTHKPTFKIVDWASPVTFDTALEEDTV